MNTVYATMAVDAIRLLHKAVEAQGEQLTAPLSECSPGVLFCKLVVITLNEVLNECGRPAPDTAAAERSLKHG